MNKSYHYEIGKKNKLIHIKVCPEIKSFHHLTGAQSSTLYREYDRSVFYQLCSTSLSEVDFLSTIPSKNLDSVKDKLSVLLMLEFFLNENDVVFKKVNKKYNHGGYNNNYSYYITNRYGYLYLIFDRIDTTEDPNGIEVLYLQSLSKCKNTDSCSRWTVINKFID